MKITPAVSIVIVNFNGVQHLPDCIRSIRRQDYPSDRIEIVVVDNGSHDGSIELLESKYPDVHLLRNQGNEGFAKPSNDGARAANGEYVAFLNNDMRVEKNWLSELMVSLTDGGADCAGSLILNWDGTAIDFMEGGIGFYGYGFQKHFGDSLRKVSSLIREDRELLFACGGAMMLKRQLFLDAGGFDEDYFAYYEDIDLGWRLHVMGCKVKLSVRSRVCHRHNGTSRNMPRPRVQYLFERNKLYSCYKNYGDTLFYKVFLPSILLEIRETCLFSHLDATNYDLRNPAAFDKEPVRLSAMSGIKLNALNAFVEALPRLREKRVKVQGMRAADDSQLVPLFDDPFIVFPKDTPDFLDARREVVKTFGIDTLLDTPLRDRVTFLFSGDAEKDAPWIAAARTLSQDEAYSVTAVGANPEAGHDADSICYADYGGGDAADAVTQAYRLIICAFPSGWNDELKEKACHKTLAIDAAAFDSGDDHPFTRFAAENGACYFCFSQDAAAKVRDALKAVRRLPAESGIEREDYIRNVGKSGNKLADEIHRFCAGSKGLPRRPENYQEDAMLLFAGSPDASVGERLEHLERIMVREHRLLRAADENVQDIREQVDLMDRRFRKLKKRLAQLPIVRRFVRD